MKPLLFLLALLCCACSSPQEQTTDTPEADNSAGTDRPQIQPAAATPAPNARVKSWSGKLQDKIPVFVQYQQVDDVLVGELTYLNTKARQPIRLLGTVEADESYRLLEFEPTGNITGIITGSPGDSGFSGSWFSPKTRKSLPLLLTRKDTTLHVPDLQPAAAEIYGKYSYKYGPDGHTGSFEIQQLPGGRAVFELVAVTASGNLANVEPDTIAFSGDSFTYTIPNSDKCGFRAKFYKGFVRISYTNGHCPGQFGHNATIDGLFVKTE